jgi:endonuclease/exonuclease/phosphatase family metal-dependent hydrolase
VRLKLASYNIHKGVGADGRRDPDRILRVLREIGADVVALQEVDRRFGSRASVLPRVLVEEGGWQVAPLAMRADSMGWHGNAILVRRGIEVLGAEPVHLPVIEPRGAVRAELAVDGARLRVVGAHLDLSGLRRKHQIRTILNEIDGCDDCPAVVLGDFNEWSPRGGSVRQFGHHWQVIAPGRSFPSRQPLAPLDRIALSQEWRCEHHGVHHSALAVAASDHLPVWAEISRR